MTYNIQVKLPVVMSKNNCSNRDNGALLAIKIEFKNNTNKKIVDCYIFVSVTNFVFLYRIFAG